MQLYKIKHINALESEQHMKINIKYIWIIACDSDVVFLVMLGTSSLVAT